jgi:tetratricopeptide (TPR) repeat protein
MRIKKISKSKSAGKQRRDQNTRIDLCGRALQKNPCDSDAYFVKAKELKRACEYQNAINHYNIGLVYNPFNAIALNNRGEILAFLGDTSKAITDFKRALEIDPKLMRACYNLALAETKMVDLQSAMEHYFILEKAYPGNDVLLREMKNLRSLMAEIAVVKPDILEKAAFSDSIKTDSIGINSTKPESNGINSTKPDSFRSYFFRLYSSRLLMKYVGKLKSWINSILMCSMLIFLMQVEEGFELFCCIVV